MTATLSPTLAPIVTAVEIPTSTSASTSDVWTRWLNDYGTSY